jgi:hypothetical protein
MGHARADDVNHPLTVFLLVPVIPYSSEVQQPAPPMAILGSRPHPCQTAPFVCEHGRASSWYPDGLIRAVQSAGSSGFAIAGLQRSRTGTCGQWPSTAQGDVAAGEMAKLPAQIEWSGAGSNCRPSAFQVKFDRRRLSLDVA